MSIRVINALTLFIVIVGGINWGLVGAFGLDLIGGVLGNGAPDVDGETAVVARLAYGLIGLSALWQMVMLFRRLAVRD